MQGRTEILDRAKGDVNANFGQDWKKTIDDVFDEVTLKNLQQLISQGVISTIENVIATGKDHTIREFLDVAFNHVGISDWTKYVKQDERFMRPAEVAVLCGDSSKARDILGWKPKTSFKQMVVNMVDNDLELSKVWLN